MIIQYLLIALMIGVLALVVLIIVGIAAVMLPELTNQVANMVGIGRGADLLLYLTVVAFVFVSLNIYLKFRDLDERIVELARAIALLEAERTHGLAEKNAETDSER
jgi:hypothetical protein